MKRRWCNACGESFLPRAQSPRQTYCTKEPCQRERKRLWQQTKRKSDPDYLENQLGAQRAWSKRNPDYWKSYRTKHPAYVSQNRAKQQARNHKSTAIAKMDLSGASAELPSGVYQLTKLSENSQGPADVWTVLISVIAQKHES